MAGYGAVAAAGQAILGLLAQASQETEFEGARFELYQASNMRAPMEDGVSLYLYRIIPSAARRNLPPRVGPLGERYRPPLPLDLYYLLTAWARTAARQQRMLAWAIRKVLEQPTLPANLLNHFSPDPDTFQANESVEVMAETIPLLEMGSVWEVNKENQQPSFVLIARMVAIDSTLAMTEGPAVQTRDLGFKPQAER